MDLMKLKIIVQMVRKVEGQNENFQRIRFKIILHILNSFSHTKYLIVCKQYHFHGILQDFGWRDFTGSDSWESWFGRIPEDLENFLKYAKIFLRKVHKSIILAHFAKNVKKPALVFRAYGRKSLMKNISSKIFNFFKISQQFAFVFQTPKTLNHGLLNFLKHMLK